MHGGRDDARDSGAGGSSGLVRRVREGRIRVIGWLGVVSLPDA